MKRRLLLTVTVFGCLAATGAAEEQRSGLRPGGKIQKLRMLDVSGPFRGREIEAGPHLRDRRAAVVLFVSRRVSESADLVTALDRVLAERTARGADGYVVFLAGPGAIPKISTMGHQFSIRLSLGILPGGEEQADLRHYRLNPAAGNTALVYQGTTVRAAFVNVDRTTVPQITEAVDRLLDGKGR